MDHSSCDSGSESRYETSRRSVVVLILTINQVELHVVQGMLHQRGSARSPDCPYPGETPIIELLRIVLRKPAHQRITVVRKIQSFRFSRPPNSLDHSPLCGCGRDKSCHRIDATSAGVQSVRYPTKGSAKLADHGCRSACSGLLMYLRADRCIRHRFVPIVRQAPSSVMMAGAIEITFRPARMRHR